jgi:High-affinity nickel-transport protein
MTITAASVVIPVVFGGLKTLNLVGDQLGPTDGGGFWDAIGTLNDNFGVLGYVIVGLFVVAWLVSFVVYRLERYDEIEAIAPRERRPHARRRRRRGRSSLRRPRRPRAGAPAQVVKAWPIMKRLTAILA